MSFPPLPRSNKQNSNQNTWHEIINLAEILLIQPDLALLLSCLSDGLERLFSCQTRIWLEPSISSLVSDEKITDNVILLRELSHLVEKAIQQKQLTPKLQGDSQTSDPPSVIAIPLITQDGIIGAVQLERTTQVGFTHDDIEYIDAIMSPFSFALNCLLQRHDNSSLRNNLSQLTSIDEISQSILSNLDRESLVNSIITILHQIFDYSRVYIFTTRVGDSTTLRKIGITRDGLDPETFYYPNGEETPVDWCISRLEPVTINDISNESRFLPAIFGKYAQSELALPLLQGDLLIGVLELCADSINAFLPDTVQILIHLADKIAVAIRNANLFRSEQIKRLVVEHLQAGIGPITVDRSLEELYNIILDELAVFLPWEVAGIWLLDTFSEEIGIDQFISAYHLAAIRGKDRDAIDIFDTYLLNPTEANELVTSHPWMNEAINHKSPVIRSKTSSYEPFGALLGFENHYSALNAPLMINDQVIGTIVCVDHLPDQYDGESLSTLQSFANFVAVAIENARLYSVAHDQAWITTVLLQVTEATQSISNLDDLLETIVNILPELIGVNACTIFLRDPSVEAFFCKAWNGLDEEQAARLKAWDITLGSATAFEYLMERRSPVILNSDTISVDIAATVFPNYDFDHDLMILFPLLTQNSLSGALLVDFSNSDLTIGSPQDVWDEKYTLIQGVTRQAAIAIENLQLIKAQEEEAYISVALLQVAQAVVSLNQLDEILATIVRITPILVGVKRCIIYVWDVKDQVFRQSQYFGFSKSELTLMGQIIKADEFPFIGAIQLNDRIIYHSLSVDTPPVSWNELTENDYHVIAGFDPDSDEEISIKLNEESFTGRERLLIGFPLSVKAENLGVMLVEEEDPLKASPSIHIREKRLEIVKGITQQAAIAIKNEQLQQEAVKSERMERELQLAREIQATFLPDKIPEIPGWDVDARWQPARQVGGDFYDILLLDENKIGFIMADVADKGMPAALFMTLIRTLIRAAAKEKSSPASVLKQVNELLIPDSKQGMFVTVFYGVLSLDSGSLLYANAGHNPPIVKQFDGDELHELTRTSIALGIFDSIEVEERQLLLNLGDWLLLYTDGITEAFSLQEEMFGKERLMKLLTEHEFFSSKRLLDIIEGSVNEFIRGTDLSDDMTMAAIHRIHL